MVYRHVCGSRNEKGYKARAADDIEILGKLLGRIDFSPKRHREHRPFQINRFLKV